MLNSTELAVWKEGMDRMLPESIADVDALFRKFDRTGNGKLAFFEVLHGCEATLGLTPIGIFNVNNAALQAFRESTKRSSRHRLGKSDFTLFLTKLHMRVGMLIEYGLLDDDQDHRLTQEEFEAGWDRIVSWRIPGKCAEEVFDLLDHDSSGRILFKDFCKLQKLAVQK